MTNYLRVYFAAKHFVALIKEGKNADEAVQRLISAVEGVELEIEEEQND